MAPSTRKRIRFTAVLLGCTSLLLAAQFQVYKVGAQTQGPILISRDDSTRAIAFESVTRQREPFSRLARVQFGPDAKTRVMLFAKNLQLQAGETVSAVSADAEDAEHHIYQLVVEHIDAVPDQPCTTCHLGQFTTPTIPMCTICHSNTSGGNPPLKSFPADFNEPFNVKFDHAQHLTPSARPKNGCAGCHATPISRGLGFSIPVNLNAHSLCYSCHTPNSKTAAGSEMASCGVCHEQKKYARTSTNARGFRSAFSHAEHGPRQRLECNDCHQITAGAAQSKQVSSPGTSEHFPTGRGMNCVTCHNGRRSFGGDLGFKDCRRCHTGSTFRMPT